MFDDAEECQLSGPIDELVPYRQDRPRGTSRTCADGLHRRHDKGRPGLTRYAQGCQSWPATTAQAARFGYAGGWLGRLLNAFAG
jgi:hypothetical protein